MSDISDLIKPITESEYWTTLKADYDAAKVAWRSWGTRNPFLVVSRFTTLAASALRDTVLQLARGMFLQYATGAALTLFAASCYQLERQPATFARGRVVLELSPNVAPTPVVSGQLRVGTPGPVTEKSKVFSSVTGGTLLTGEKTIIEFDAEGTGDSYNLPVGSPIDLKTSLVGVTATIEATGEPTTIGTGNASLVFWSAKDGVTVEIVDPGAPGQALVLNFDPMLGTIQISLATDGFGSLISTASQVRAAIGSNLSTVGTPTPLVELLVSCVLGGDGTGIVQPTTPVTLEWTGT